MDCCWNTSSPINSPDGTRPGNRKVGSQDDSFHGPTASRQCTDIFWLFLFAIFFVYMVCVVITAAIKGDFRRFTRGYDNHGNICGTSNNMPYPGAPLSGQDTSNKTLLLFRGLRGKERECVQECPPEFFKLSLGICIERRIGEKFEKYDLSFIEAAVEDFVSCFREVIYMVLIGILFTLVFVFILKYLAKIVVWVTILVVIILCVGASVFSWVSYTREVKALNGLNSTDESYEKENKRVEQWKTGGIIFTVVSVIVFLVLIYLRKSIRLVTSLFKETGRALADMPTVLVQPAITFVVIITICILWLLGLLAMVSVATPVVDSANQTVTFRANRFYLSNIPIYVLSLLWLAQTVLNCQLFIIAGGICQWYFTRDKTAVDSPLATHTSRLIRYHLGSILLGSLLVAVVKIIRAIVKLFYLARILQHTEEAGTEVEASGCRCSCMCCLHGCIDSIKSIITYVNRNAFIIIALYGWSFCESAKRAIRMITEHAIHVAAINTLGDFLLFLAKITVVIATIFCGLDFLNRREDVHDTSIPLCIGAFITYLVADSCISVYEMGIDTLFLCFCEDLDRNDGVQRPYYMSAEFKDIIDQGEVILKPKEKITA